MVRWIKRASLVVALLFVAVVIFIPSVPSGVPAYPLQTASNMKQIAVSAQTFMNATSRRRLIIAQSAHEWAAILARETGLNDYSLYVGYEERQRIKDSRILFKDGDINPEFLEIDLAFDIIVPPVGVVFSYSTTPLFWTRGIKEDGAWDFPPGWVEGVGMVAYFDTHVDRFRESASFVRWADGETTTSIFEAIPAGSVILSGLAD